MRSVECGIDWSVSGREVQLEAYTDIPHSEFRIPHFSTFRIPHSALAVEDGVLLRAPGRSEPEVAVGARRGAAAARRTGEEPLLHEERFVDLLERSGVFAHRRRDRGQADGTPFELLDDRLEDAAVHVIEAELVHVEPLQRLGGDRRADIPVRPDLAVAP